MSKFTLEGDTLYYGRDDSHHGFNLGQLTDRSFNCLDILNATVSLAVEYAPPALETIDGVMTDKSQDADWLRARYFEQSAEIDSLEAERTELTIANESLREQLKARRSSSKRPFKWLK